MKNIHILIVFIASLSAMNYTNGQCTANTYGAYGSPNPSCGSGGFGAWASTTWAYSREYSTVNVTAGRTYQFQSYVTSGGASRYTTITTTANGALAWGTTNTFTSVTWTATFTGQVRFWTHLSNFCGSSTVNQTRRVRCSTPSAPPPPPPCATNNVNLNITAGSWAGEVSWTLVNASGATVATGGAPYSQNLCLPTGCYTFNMFDSYGDGWNGANYTFTLGGASIGTGTLSSGSSGSAQIGIGTSCAPPCSGTQVNLNMTDTFGDGWNGAQFRIQAANGTIYGPYTLANGTSAVQQICLPNGCYRVILTAGSWPGEIGWSLTSGSSTTYASATAPNAAPNNILFTIGGATCPVPPSNNLCANAATINLGANPNQTHTSTGIGSTNTLGLTEFSQTWMRIDVPCGGMNVTVNFCGNSQVRNNAFINLFSTCGTNPVLTQATNWNFTTCSNGSIVLNWTNLPAGTYYYPILIDNILWPGAYSVGVSGTSSYAPTLSAAPTTGDMVWRGASSTDWATLPNWWQYNGTAYVSATAAPTTTQNVIIPANQACVLNQPNTNANSGAAKTLRIENGATLSMTNGSLTVAENWVNNGTFTPGTGTVTFTGSGTHTISGSSGAHNFHNLTMNKTGEVQLSVPIAMTGALTLNNGRLNIGNYDLDLPTNTVSGGNAASFVRTSGSGTLNRNVGSTAVSFPVGNTTYNAAILANSGTSDKYSIRVIDNVTDDGTAVGAQTTMAVVNRTWMIDEQVAGGSNVNLTLQWNGPAEEVNNFSESSAFIAHYMAADGLWDNIGGTVQSPGVIQAGGITSFSPFTVSSDNSFAPLPVKLTSFQANCTEKGYNSITWQTESETNSSHFIVERSRDGAVWSTVSSLPAAGTSVELKNYVISDISAGANFEGYYRLRQVDFDGEQEVFGPISINCDHIEHDYVEVYPNPSNGNFKARVYSNNASSNVLIKVCAANGKVVHQQMTNLEKGLTTLFFEQNQLEKGMYFIQIESENSKLEPQKLIIH